MSWEWATETKSAITEIVHISVGVGLLKFKSFHKQTQLKYWINDKINSNNNNNSQTFTTPSNPVWRDCLSLLSHACFRRARHWIVCIIFNVFKTRLAPTIRLLPNHHSFNNSKIWHHLQRKFIFPRFSK